MSKTLSRIERDQRVFSILQNQIDSQRKSVETAQIILNEIMAIRDEVNNVKAEVTEKFQQMAGMVQEVRDSVTLNNAECFQLQSEVATKSIQLTKDRYSEEEGTFKQVVGVYRRMIWKNLKRRYNVPRYNCIRRIDFKDAVEFIRQFRPEDYL